jgi:hypothetical protein
MNDLLAEISLDAFLVGRYCVGGPGLPEGRAWERAVATLLHRPGLSRHQQAGLTTLFGTRSLSGCRHELDAAAHGWRGCYLIECKAQGGGVDKSEVATFDLKTFDYYAAQLGSAVNDRWWRILVSAAPVSDSIRALCFRIGIILCDPGRFPLPVLLRAAGQPAADEVLPAVKLRELVRLGETTCEPLQQRWRIVGDEIHFRPRHWNRQDVQDLLWLQDELSDDLFDVYDTWAPGRIERRVAILRQQIRARERTHA